MQRAARGPATQQQVDADSNPVSDAGFAATFDWGTGRRSLGVATATGLDTSFSYEPATGRLAALNITANGVSLGGLSYTWDARRGIKVAGSSTPGEPAITGGFDWTAEYDAAGRMVQASAGSHEALGDWVFGYGKADELRFIVERSAGREDFTSGAQGCIESRTGPTGTAVFRYDVEGRRIEDDQFLYTWDWRGRLVQVEAKASVPDHAGERLVFSYDAIGRLRARTWEGAPDENGERPFIAKRVLTWDGQRLAAEAGMNHQEEVLWRTQYLPGPRWLDDAPLVRVESGLLSGNPSTGLYALIRDEMGTVVGVVEPRAGQPPALLTRYLGSSYGQTHVELSPQLVYAVFDATETELGDVAQEPVEGESIAGALLLRTTLALATSSIDAGLLVERWTGTAWEPVPQSELAIGTDPSDSTTLLLLSQPAWPKGERYRITLTPSLTDDFGRALLKEYEMELEVPEDGVTPPRYERSYAVDRDSAVAASNTLGGAFPGGQPFGFQGLWTDSLSGLHYARQRWYDSRNASWLSPDPQGAVDSQNLYAYVAHRPRLATDPLGEKTWVTYDESTHTLRLDGFIEFFGEDGSPELARQISASIETGWTKNVRMSDGRTVTIKANIHYIYTKEGERFRNQNYDQILLYRDRLLARILRIHEWSQVNLEDPVTGAPAAKRTGYGEYQRSIAGGVSVGRISLTEFEGDYPGAGVHEWGHIIGFWFHVKELDFPSERTKEQIDRYAREEPEQLDPMRSARIPPEDYLISEKEVKCLIEFAEMQSASNPASIAGPIEIRRCTERLGR